MSLRVWLSALALASFTLLPLTAQAQPAAPTGPWKCENLNVTIRAYPVADLTPPGQLGPCAFSEMCCDPDHPSPAPAHPPADVLIRLITGTIAPQSWQQNGGSGTIEYLPCANALLIRQTPEVQAQVGEALDSLRRQDDPQVSVEVRFIQVPDEILQRIGFEFGRTTDGNSEPSPAFLNAEQAIALLKLVQRDPRSSIAQAPRVTTMDRQRAAINLGENQWFVTGLSVSTINGQVIVTRKNEPVEMGSLMRLLPTISADRRFINLDFHCQTREVNLPIALVPISVGQSPSCSDGEEKSAAPLTQYIQQPTFNVQRIDTRVCVPDGGSVLLCAGQSVHETCSETAVPVLSKVPYVGRLFKNIGYGRETVSTLVLITPRIIVPDEAEEKAAACCPPKSADCVVAAASCTAAVCPAAACSLSIYHPTGSCPRCCQNSDATSASCPKEGCCQSSVTKPACCAAVVAAQPLRCEALQVMPTPVAAPAPCCPVVGACCPDGSPCPNCPLMALIPPAMRPSVAAMPVPPPAVMMQRVLMGQVPALPATPAMRVVGTFQAAPVCSVSVTTSSVPNKRLAFFLDSYHRACAAGLPDVAREMALHCLEIDPTCFSDKK